MSQFPWDHLKAETLRSICRDITGGHRLSRTKEEMTEFLQNVNERGMKFDIPPPRSAPTTTTTTPTRTSRKRTAAATSPDDGDDDDKPPASARTGAATPKRRRISTRSTGELKGIQTRGMKTGAADVPGKWKALSTRGKAALTSAAPSAAAAGGEGAPRKRGRPPKNRAGEGKAATKAAAAPAKRTVRARKVATAGTRRVGRPSGSRKAAVSRKQKKEEEDEEADEEEGEGEEADAEGEQEEPEDAEEKEEEKEKKVFDGVMINKKPSSSAPRSQRNSEAADLAIQPAAEVIVIVADASSGATSTAVVNGSGQQTDVVAAVPALANGNTQQVEMGDTAATNGSALLEEVQVKSVTVEVPAAASVVGQQSSTLLPDLVVTAPSVVGSEIA